MTQPVTVAPDRIVGRMGCAIRRVRSVAVAKPVAMPATATAITKPMGRLRRHRWRRASRMQGSQTAHRLGSVSAVKIEDDAEAEGDRQPGKQTSGRRCRSRPRCARRLRRAISGRPPAVPRHTVGSTAPAGRALYRPCRARTPGRSRPTSARRPESAREGCRIGTGVQTAGEAENGPVRYSPSPASACRSTVRGREGPDAAAGERVARSGQRRLA